MKHRIIIIIGLIVLLFSCEKEISPEQADKFIKFYGNYLIDEARDIEVLDNGGYAICGIDSLPDLGKRMVLVVTDEYGNFYFHHLPYGSYLIDAEKAGYQTSVSSLIALSPSHKNETGVVLTLSAEKIAVNRTDFSDNNKTVEIYPNPARDRLHIFITDEILNTGFIEVYNTYGRLVLTTNQVLPNDQNTLELDVSSLPAGIYLGRCVGEQANHRFTFIKN